MQYNALHVHSHFSQLDGVGTPVEYARRAADIGMTAVALTDHGTLSGHREWVREMRAVGVKPVLGCFPPGHMIHTIGGAKPIEKIIPGDVVLTHTGHFKKVLSTMTRPYEGPLFGFSVARNGSDIMWVTSEHPVLISDFNGSANFVKAEDVVGGYRNSRKDVKNYLAYGVLPRLAEGQLQYILPVEDEVYSYSGNMYTGKYYRKDNSFSHTKVWQFSPIQIDDEVGRFLGLWAAEGSAGKDGAITFTFNTKEQDYADFVIAVAKKIGFNLTQRNRPERGTIDLFGCYMPLARWLREHIGTGARTKKIPEQILFSPKLVRMAFFVGLCDGDAKDHDGQWTLKLSSRDAVFGARLLAADFDSYAEVKTVLSSGFTHFYITVSHGQHKWGRSHGRDCGVIVPLRKVEQRQYSGTVYNFEVEGDNSYVSNIAVHNCEAYFTKDRFDKRGKEDRNEPLDLIYNHLVILAKNDQGLENLSRLNEVAWNEGFFKKPRIDFEVLDKYGDGLIISSACMSGLLNKAIESEDYTAAKTHIEWFKSRFGNDFYVEVMPHNVPGMNAELLALADAMGIQTIVTPDCHHATVDQKDIQEVMLLLNTGAKPLKESTFKQAQDIEDLMERFDYLYGADRKMTFRDFDIHLLSGEEMQQAMLKDGIDRKDIFDNTLVISDQVDEYTIRENLNLLPVQYRDPDAQLEKLASAGLKKRGLEDEQYLSRLQEELQIIKDKKFAPYFLVVRNMLTWARKQGILVGPGRGSSAGSLVCYALEITDIDPIEHGLLFFRFIDPSRSDWPDVDTDIQDTRRDEVKDYLIRQYRHVAGITTFLEFKDKGVVRDVARVLNVPLSDVNKALKMVDTWEEFVSSQNTREFRMRYPEVTQIAERLRGRIRGTGIHAAGIVTSKEPIAKVAPMETRKAPGIDERIPVVAVDMDEAARIGLIKIDALGLKTLSVIADTLSTIKERHGIDIELKDLTFDDNKIYQMLSYGHTKGVFQAEAGPYTNLLLKMGVSSFAELAASNALVRPGAMNTIGKEYIARKRGKALTLYAHPILQSFTEETYGEIIYQEQVMLALTELGGMSMEDANKVRKIIGKKKDVKEFEAYKKKFVTGASKHIGKEGAEKLWKSFEAHANYSFNKSHAVAYSTLSYWTAWLKLYYPLEFMFALLKNETDSDKRTEYLTEAKRLGISIRLPHINESDIGFKIEGDAIRFGLSSIKYLSDLIAGRYIAARPFASKAAVEEFTFTKGAGVNSRAMDAMNKVGALAFADNPPDEKYIRSNLYEYLSLPEFNFNIPAHYSEFLTDVADFEDKGAFIMMVMVRGIKRGKGWSRVDFIDKTGAAGVFDREDTTLEAGKTYLMLAADNRIVKAIPAESITESDDAVVKFMNLKEIPYGAGEYFVLAFKKRTTKAGKKMATLMLANSERDLASVTVFPSVYGDAFVKLDEGDYYMLELGMTKEGSITYKGVVK